MYMSVYLGMPVPSNNPYYLAQLDTRLGIGLNTFFYWVSFNMESYRVQRLPGLQSEKRYHF